MCHILQDSVKLSINYFFHYYCCNKIYTIPFYLTKIDISVLPNTFPKNFKRNHYLCPNLYFFEF